MRYLLPKLGDCRLPDLCASFQEAVVDVLVAKTLRAAQATGRAYRRGQRRRELQHAPARKTSRRACAQRGLELLIAEPALCTDNAAMIGYVAALRVEKGQFSPLTIDIDPNLGLAQNGA